MNLLVINGPNLNLLGIREPNIYGDQSFSALERFIQAAAQESGASVELFQSNHEGAIVDKIQSAYGRMHGIVINPAAYTHTSVAILDALKAVALPAVEVHLSDVTAGNHFGKSPMRAWLARSPLSDWASRATGAPSSISAKNTATDNLETRVCRVESTATV